MEFEWDSGKNEWLKENRGISFEEIVFHMSQGDLWRVSSHPDQEKYPGQKIYFIIVNDYIYLVPSVRQEKYIFLKTIIPSRKATRDYKKEIGKQDEIR